MLFSAALISALLSPALSAPAPFVDHWTAIEYIKGKYQPLPTNVVEDDPLAKFNPRFVFTDGCTPMKKYDAVGRIVWEPKSAQAWSDFCKDTNLAQIYGVKYHTDSGDLYVYAWRQLVDHPATHASGYSFSYMAVFPDASGQKPKAIWTPVGGYTETFSMDTDGRHPWVHQTRPDQNTAAGVNNFNDKAGSAGVVLTLIDVAGGGSLTDYVKQMINLEWVPVGTSHIGRVAATVLAHNPIGYPQLNGHTVGVN